jgi:hypothetical protein
VSKQTRIAFWLITMLFFEYAVKDGLGKESELVKMESLIEWRQVLSAYFVIADKEGIQNIQ